jgi:hypothetical protein
MLIFLSLLDILTGICLAFSLKGVIISIIGTLVLVKGIFSLIGSIGTRYYFDWMGWVDLISGIMLIFGIFVHWFWILPVIKGLYSMIFSFS